MQILCLFSDVKNLQWRTKRRWKVFPILYKDSDISPTKWMILWIPLPKQHVVHSMLWSTTEYQYHSTIPYERLKVISTLPNYMHDYVFMRKLITEPWPGLPDSLILLPKKAFSASCLLQPVTTTFATLLPLWSSHWSYGCAEQYYYSALYKYW